MRRSKKLVALALALSMIAAAGVLLTWVHAHQKLSAPAVKTTAVAGSHNLEVLLPEQVSDYTSEKVPIDDVVLNFLPPDTSYGQRKYSATNGFMAVANVVLMGADRTSIHKAQYCLQGQGWQLDPAGPPIKIAMERPYPYELPVIKLIGTKEFIHEGQKFRARCIYVYWFVAQDTISADPSGFKRAWLMSRELLRTGILQRWAYISYFAVCTPGQEEATFERMKKLIVESVPEFQLTPAAREPITLSSRQ